MAVTGLLLAAGAGRRMGGPKALLRHPDGTSWVARAAETLRGGGCDPVLVVLGAAQAQVRRLLPGDVRVVVAADWAQGMGASLRTGLHCMMLDAEAVAALVSLVDLPGVTTPVVARLLTHASPSGLARAGYAGSPGHPVLIGREHWAGVAAVAAGDAGARTYLRAHAADVVLVECGDLGSGDDLDTPADLPGAVVWTREHRGATRPGGRPPRPVAGP